MAEKVDCVIRNGTLVDGAGAAPRRGDVAIQGGRIAAVGDVDVRGREEVDAEGLLVTPGFVDIHTHYDGQAVWSERLDPSSRHGVTTVVMGNCGIGFAPCKAEDHGRLIRLMEGVEDIPFPVLAEGLPWNWRSFEDYLDVLDGRRFDVDVGTQTPHSALRVFVMGERGAAREPATEADRAQMAALARAAVEAGSLGFSTSRTLNHRTSDGLPIPSYEAGEAELVAIACALGEAGLGVLQFVSDFKDDPTEEMGLIRRVAERSGRPLSFSLVQPPNAPDAWRSVLAQTRAANEAGVSIKAQVCGRAIGMVLGLELTNNPFSSHPTYQAMADLPLDERVRRLRDPAVRARLFGEQADTSYPLGKYILANWTMMFPMAAIPDYEPTPEMSVRGLAVSTGLRPEQIALDHMLENGGRSLLYSAGTNFQDGSLSVCHEMLNHPDSLIGLSDGGAHVGSICDGGLPTFMLAHWTRDRTRGPKLSLEAVVKKLSADTAAAVGLGDRGRLAPGLRADINIIDYERLRLHAPTVTRDLPTDGARLMQTADGYVATYVAGVATYREGQATGALPGRLVRGAR